MEDAQGVRRPYGVDIRHGSSNDEPHVFYGRMALAVSAYSENPENATRFINWYLNEIGLGKGK